MSIGLAVLYWLGLVNLVLFDLGVSFSNEVASRLVALGALVAFVSAAWLGWVLGRVQEQAVKGVRRARLAGFKIAKDIDF